MHRALFMSDWPAYMRDFRDARYTRHTSASDISTHTSTAWARAEFDTVVWVLDDLTHGVRQNWWDGKILAAEEEMEIAERELQQQLDDEADPDYVDHDHDREF